MDTALAALKTAKAEFLRLKSESYNAKVNAKYDALAKQMQDAIDALEAAKAEAAKPAETPAE